MSKNRVLLLSWEYPPVIEGGLARHVCKLAEALVRQGVAVDVLTRGSGRHGCAGDRHGGGCGRRSGLAERGSCARPSNGGAA